MSNDLRLEDKLAYALLKSKPVASGIDHDDMYEMELAQWESDVEVIAEVLCRTFIGFDADRFFRASQYKP